MRAHIIRYNPVAAFAQTLRRRMGDDILCFRCETDQQVRPLLVSRKRCQDIGIFDEADFRRCGFLVLLDLVVGRNVRPPIGDSSGADRDIGGQRGFSCRQHFARGRDLEKSHARWWFDLDRPGNQHGTRAGAGERACNGVALLAG